MSDLLGSKISKELQLELQKEVEALKNEGLTPGLAVILVGENPASKVYVGRKEKMAKQLGFNSWIHELPADVAEADLLALIDRLNDDDTVDGLLVQLPLPDHIDEQKVINHVSAAKDVDCFHPVNVGKLSLGEEGFVPCTPYGIIYLLKAYDVPMESKHAVIIGRSNIVGKPLVQLFLAENATVSIAHSRTKNLPELTKQADILVAAVGRPRFVTADMVKPGAVVVDVGINRVDGKLVGDVDYDAVQDIASQITPVPGGVGPMTIIMLMKNTLQACRRRINEK